jgi:hypothetical protein
MSSIRGLKTAMTPGMLGTGGATPDDPLGVALHQRALAHDDEFYRQQDEYDRMNGGDIGGFHKANEIENRVNNMRTGGMGDWLYAFNEATGGKGRFARGTTFGNQDVASPNGDYGDVRQFDSALPKAKPSLKALKKVVGTR